MCFYFVEVMKRCTCFVRLADFTITLWLPKLIKKSNFSFQHDMIWRKKSDENWWLLLHEECYLDHVICNQVSTIMWDCFAFALFCLVIGWENVHHPFNQSDTTIKAIVYCWAFSCAVCLAFLWILVDLVLWYPIQALSTELFEINYKEMYIGRKRKLLNSSILALFFNPLVLHLWIVVTNSYYMWSLLWHCN